MFASNYTFLFNEKFVGSSFVSTGSGQLTSERGVGGSTISVIDLDRGDYVVGTGFYYADPNYPNYLYIQTTNGYWYAVFDTNNWKDDWYVYQNDENIKQYNDSAAQNLVNRIIRNNKRILENNLLCARFIQYFNKEQRQQIIDLQKRLNNRNNALKDPNYFKDIQSGSPDGYAEFDSNLDALMKSGGVGIATWAFIVISLVVIAGVGTAIYYSYKSFADESDADVKFSDDLTATLRNKLTDEEYEQLMTETKGIVTKARWKQAWKSSFSGIKYLALGVGAFLLVRAIRNRE